MAEVFADKMLTLADTLATSVSTIANSVHTRMRLLIPSTCKKMYSGCLVVVVLNVSDDNANMLHAWAQANNTRISPYDGLPASYFLAPNHADITSEFWKRLHTQQFVTRRKLLYAYNRINSNEQSFTITLNGSHEYIEKAAEKMGMFSLQWLGGNLYEIRFDL